jgi:sterol desaturase/sphingolipid hydroxylase (fatty acid hydroxylase superfamily)
VADGLHSIVSIIVIPELLRVACFGALASFALWAEGRLGIGLWPHGWPLAAQVALALVFIEFAQYWVHRAQHQWPLLWRFHAVHHSAPRLYWLNAGRVHPLEAVANYLVAVPILVALGCGADALTLYLVLITTSGSVQHANVDFRLGPLNWIFSQGENHRWHHAPQKRVADHNFGVVLIIWDVVFGTRKAPGAWPEEVGVEPVGAYPKGYLAHLWAPFRSSTRSIDSPPSIG